MLCLAPHQPQPQSEESEAEVDVVVEDFALADSFINFDYVPDPVVPTRVEEPKIETLGCWGTIEEEIQKISLVGESGNRDEVIANNGSESESESSDESENADSPSSSSSTSSASITSFSDVKGEELEVEEGEIVDSDALHDDEDCEPDLEDDGGGGGDGNPALGRPLRSKNELEVLPPVPPVNMTLEPHHQMLPVGVIMSVLGAQVIVEGVEKHDPLNEGSILWMTESRTPLGLVDEIFGPVKNPYYVVRYNSENEVPKGIHGGTLISFVPEYANHVLNSNNDLYKKGYDEEASDEADFSDDEKEAEYKRMQKMIKRGINDQNPGKRKNKGKKFPPQEGLVPSFPVAPAPPLPDYGLCSPFSGIGQGLPQFPSANAGSNLTTNGVWTNGTTLPQPQSALLPNGFPTNGVSCYPSSTQISHQLPVTGVPFQQQLNPSYGFPPATMFPGVPPNLFAQAMYGQGLVGQNQMTFGLSSPFPQIQPPICGGQQGFLSNELQSETNRNLHSSSIPFNHHHHASHQFNPGASANRGRTTFHRRGRNQRPAM